MRFENRRGGDFQKVFFKAVKRMFPFEFDRCDYHHLPLYVNCIVTGVSCWANQEDKHGMRPNPSNQGFRSENAK